MTHTILVQKAEKEVVAIQYWSFGFEKKPNDVVTINGERWTVLSTHSPEC